MYCSHRYLTCVADPAKTLPQWLALFFKTPAAVEQLAAASPGSADRNRTLSMDGLRAISVPLPSLDEQRRIVARVEELASKVEEARGLKKTAKLACDRFWKVFSRITRSQAHPKKLLGEIAEFLDGKRIPLSEAQRQTRRGPFPYYGASGIIDYVDDYIFDERLLLLSEDGANLVARTKPIAFIAEGKYWVNNHAHVLRPHADIVDIGFLAHALSDY